MKKIGRVRLAPSHLSENKESLLSKIRQHTSLLLVIVATSGFLLINLLGLLPFAYLEQPQNVGSANLSQIKNDILFAPAKALQLLILKFDDNDMWIRLASVVIAVTAASLFFLMLRKRHTTRISLFTTLMFITSTWFLRDGRFATVEALYLTVIPGLMLISMWFISRKDDLKLPFASALLALTLYLPGTWLFFLGVVIILRKYLASTWSTMAPRIKLLSGLSFLVTMLPLIYSFALRPGQIKMWSGFDFEQSLNPAHIANNFLDIPKQLFIGGPDNPALWLSGTPVLDIFAATMLVLGIYAYHAGPHPSREKLVLGSGLIAVLLIGAGNIIGLSLLLPVLYLIMANGIAYMLQSWFTVFPRNPIARTSGLALLTLIILLSCFYQLQRYYVAWPQAPATKQALIEHL